MAQELWPDVWTALLALLSAVCLCSLLYLLGLLAAAAWPRRAGAGKAGRSAEPLLRLTVLVPAHDEEAVLQATLDSLAAQQYPPNAFEVVVIADNCTDATAALARAAGVTVLERTNPAERGKGYALAWALARLLARFQAADAFIIIDADTWVAPDFLPRMAARLAVQTDARGYGALQGRYGVLNAAEGWRAALMAAAFDLFNHVKPLGRDRLRLGAGLKGNGMAFTRALLAAAPWRGDSVTEDIDYALDLVRHHGVRVGYAPEARVRAQMPTTAKQAASQRQRWEGGRYQLLRGRALPLLAEGLRRRSPLLLDAAADLLLPPLAELAGLLVLGGVLLGVGDRLHLVAHPAAWAAALTAGGLGLLVYVLGGLRVSEAPPEAYRALLRAPVYAVWKLGLYGLGLLRRRRGPTEWVRTQRAPLESAARRESTSMTESEAA